MQSIILSNRKEEVKQESIMENSIPINNPIPISLRVQRLMKDKVEFED